MVSVGWGERCPGVGVDVRGLIFLELIDDFLDGARFDSAELFWGDGFSYLFLHVDCDELFAHHFLQVPGGDEFLVYGDEDVLLLR